MTSCTARGIALVIVLIAMAVFSAIGLGLVLTTSSERLAGANYDERVHAANAADAAIELTVREIAAIDDWDLILRGAQPSRIVEGVAPADLSALTNQLTCGWASSCTEARRRTSTSDRPWGANNPAWTVFLRAPLSTFMNLPAVSADMYIVVWVGDDARETDADPLADGGGANGEGGDVVRARAEVFTRRGTRYAVEADLIRQAAGIRVQSWRVAAAVVP